jgi:prepilin-type N-terminal cleavage/methylation domain-containing protein
LKYSIPLLPLRPRERAAVHLKRASAQKRIRREEGEVSSREPAVFPKSKTQMKCREGIFLEGSLIVTQRMTTFKTVTTSAHSKSNQLTRVQVYGLQYQGARNKMRDRQKGFSLIELLIVVAIILGRLPGPSSILRNFCLH